MVLNLLELGIVSGVQLMQIPSFIFGWKVYPSIIIRIAFSFLILLGIVLLYLLGRNLEEKKTKIVITIQILMFCGLVTFLKIVSLSLVSSATMCGVCELYCIHMCFISYVPGYSGMLALLSDCILLSFVALVYSRLEEFSTNNKKNEIETGRGLNEETPKKYAFNFPNENESIVPRTTMVARDQMSIDTKESPRKPIKFERSRLEKTNSTKINIEERKENNFQITDDEIIFNRGFTIKQGKKINPMFTHSKTVKKF